MKRLFILFLLTTTYFAAGINEPDIVITSENLKNSPVTRLSDILEYYPIFNYNTINGFNYSFSVGNPLFQELNSWKMVIDGVELNSSVLDFNHINMIPVNLTQIDSILVYSSSPGELGGKIEIYTNKDYGFNASGRIMYGNESGDPGPFKYTPLSSSNVDKTGPDLTGQIQYNTPEAGISLLVDTKSYIATDSNNDPVRSDEIWEHKSPITSSVAAEAYYNFSDFILKYNLYYSQIGDNFANTHYGTETWFLNETRTLIPIEYMSLLHNVSLEKKYDKFNFRADFSYGRNRLHNSRLFDNSFLIEQFARDFNIAAGYQPYKTSKFEFVYKYSKEEYNFGLPQHYKRHKFLVKNETLLPSQFKIISSADYENSEDYNRWSAGLKISKQMKNSAISLSGYFGQTDVPFINKFFFYHIPQDPDYVPINPDPLIVRIAEVLNVNLEFKYSPYKNLNLSLKPGFSALGNYYGKSFTANKFNGTLYRMFDADNHNEVITVDLQGEYSHNDIFFHNLSYRYSDCDNGFLPLARHKAAYKFSVLLKHSFRTGMFVTYNSNYDLNTGTSYYDYKLNDFVNIDLYLKKGFWQDRITGELNLKNLLNDTNNTHPYGASKRFALYAVLSVVI